MKSSVGLFRSTGSSPADTGGLGAWAEHARGKPGSDSARRVSQGSFPGGGKGGGVKSWLQGFVVQGSRGGVWENTPEPDLGAGQAAGAAEESPAALPPDFPHLSSDGADLGLPCL